MSNYTSLFSFYGGKSKLVHLYPVPKYECIIEPFAGAASYSLRYFDRKILLNDINPRIYSIWKFLLEEPNALKLIKKYIPNEIEVGTNIFSLIDKRCSDGILNLMSAGANQGTFGGKSFRKIVSKFGRNRWHCIIPKMEYFIPKINHWKVSKKDFNRIKNKYKFTTWFVDPPYSNLAGRQYAYSQIDYQQLSAWCMSRRGQVIVCENEDATWLPFKSLTVRRGIYSSYQKSKPMEVYCEIINGKIIS